MTKSCKGRNEVVPVEGARIILASGVLLGGISLALLFRHPAAPVGVPPGATDPLVLRQRSLPAAPAHATRYDGLPAARAAEPVIATAPSAAHPALDEPPSLARTYPDTQPIPTSRWGSSMGLGGKRPCEEDLERTHTVVDGDTLTALAERYLGSPGRALEIYNANRLSLPSPDVLPIGVELRIPLRGHGATATAGANPEPALVPLPPRGK
jgi:nucleoid-associated protein YgaU